MLSDRERSTLHEIQRQFLAEDPGFVQAFIQRLPSASRQPIDEHRRMYTTDVDSAGPGRHRRMK